MTRCAGSAWSVFPPRWSRLRTATTVDGAEPRIDIAQRVRPALTLLLEEGAPRVIVEENGVPVGFLDLAAIQRASVPRVDGNAA